MKKFVYEKTTLEQTKKYLKEIIDNLSDDKGMINGEWYLSLKILEENVNIYFTCVNHINNNGLIVKSRLEADIANPHIKIKNDVQNKIIAILNDFALTKKSQKKINGEVDSTTSPLDNFFKGKKEIR